MNIEQFNLVPRNIPDEDLINLIKAIQKGSKETKTIIRVSAKNRNDRKEIDRTDVSKQEPVKISGQKNIKQEESEVKNKRGKQVKEERKDLNLINPTPQQKIIMNKEKSRLLEIQDPDLEQCFKCLKLSKAAIPQCKHTQCLTCFKNQLLKLKFEILEEKIECPECRVNFDTDFIFKLLGGKSEFVKIQQEAVEIDYPKLEDQKAAVQFECSICFEQLTVNEGITLNCDHRYCQSCITGHIDNLINEGKVTEEDMRCPQCPTQITPQEIEGNTKKENYARYLEFSMRKYKPNNKKLVFKQCFKCDAPMEIPKNIREIECPGCQSVYCPQCNNKHTHMSCKEFLKSKEKNHEEDILAIENLVRCPRCKNGIVKDAGCNFLLCKYPNCRRVYFCYLCGKELKRTHHYSHYKKSGPYGNSCNTQDKIKDD